MRATSTPPFDSRVWIARAVALTLVGWFTACGAAGSPSDPARDSTGAPLPSAGLDPDAFVSVLVCHGTHEAGVCPVVPLPVDAIPATAQAWDELNARCEEGDLRSCWIHAFLRAAPWHHPSVEGIGMDDWAANFQRMTDACTAGELLACSAASAVLDTGIGRPDRQVERAGERWEATCQQGDDVACANLAAYFWRYSARPEGPAEDLARMAAEGNATAALLLGAARLRGATEGEQAEGVLLLDEACGAGDQTACMVRRRLSAMRSEPTDPAHDGMWAKASALCALGHPLACDLHGWGLWTGDGGAQDPQTGAALLVAGCRAGHAAACAWAARLAWELDPSDPAAEEMLRIGCHLGETVACELLRDALSFDPARRRASQLEVCAVGSATACAEVAGYPTDPTHRPRTDEDWERLEQSLRVGCMNGVIAACREAAVVLRERPFRETGMGDAVGLARFACTRGDGDACLLLARLQWAVEGAAGDPVTTARWACDTLRHRPSCAEQAMMELIGTNDDEVVQRAVARLESMCAESQALACFRRAQVPALRPELALTGSAVDYAASGCALGDDDACAYEAEAALASGESTEAVARRLEAACERGGTRACAELAPFVADAGDAARGLALAQDACRRGVRAGCGNEALLLRAAGRFSEAAALLESLCRVHHGEECLVYVDLHRHPEFAEAEPAIIPYALLAACAGRVAEACVQLADLLPDGAVFEGHTAEEIRAVACQMGRPDQCQE